MNLEQIKFANDVEKISGALGDWVATMFRAGFSVSEVKALIRKTGELCR